VILVKATKTPKEAASAATKAKRINNETTKEKHRQVFVAVCLLIFFFSSKAFNGFCFLLMFRRYIRIIMRKAL